jgi:imidazolonepropionase-like amidohydrolase
MKTLKKTAKFLGALLLAIVAVFFAGVLWPLEAPTPPKREGKLLVAGAAYVDVRSGELVRGQDILIVEGQIVQIGPDLPRGGAKVIDATGRFVIPGLFDMHAHSMKMSPLLHHPMFIAAGVTAIRDMGGCIGLEDDMVACIGEKQAWHQAAASGQGVHPRYDQITSLAINDGSEIPTDLGENWWVKDANSAQRRAEFDEGRGVDFLKTYSNLNREAYFALAEAVADRDIYLAGHVPFRVSSQEAAQAGQRSFEHAFTFIWDCYPKADELRAADNIYAFFTNEARTAMIEGHDAQQCSDLHTLMIENGTAYVPTHTTRKLDAFAQDEAFRTDARLKYIPTPLRTMWLQDADAMAKRAGEGGAASYKAVYEFGLQQTAIAHKAGVTVLAGSDAPDSFAFPGFGLHDELAHMVEAGLSPLDALRAATLEPAKFLGIEGQAGEVTIGARADLVLLAANPLEDIEAVRQISDVVLAGVHYDSNARAALLEGVEVAANSWTMWPKFIWDIINSPIMLRQFAD